jgi:uncharacterized SAM-binding protein YcdF (DUF218 family)
MADHKRTHFSQLPSIIEVEEILKREAKRGLPNEKENKHYVDFSLVVEWLNAIGLDPDIFVNQYIWQEVMEKSEILKKEVVARTLKLNVENITKKVSLYLGEKDNLIKSDLIWVFGSKDINRIRLGVELLKSNWGRSILITGGNPNYSEGENQKTEAEVFGKEALKLGVDKDKIIIETKSITVPDNVRSGLNLLDSLNVKVGSIICVIAWFAMRRAEATLQKYTKVGTVVFKVSPATSNPELSKESWFKNELGIKTIFNEFVKMKVAMELNTI